MAKRKEPILPAMWTVFAIAGSGAAGMLAQKTKNDAAAKGIEVPTLARWGGWPYWGAAVGALIYDAHRWNQVFSQYKK